HGMVGRDPCGHQTAGDGECGPIGDGDQEQSIRHWLSPRRIDPGCVKDRVGESAQPDDSHDAGKNGTDTFQREFHNGRSFRQAFVVDRGPDYSWERGRDSTVGGPNHVVSASMSPGSVRSPTQATYPSGRINTTVGGVTVPTTGISHVPTYLASID